MCVIKFTTSFHDTWTNTGWNVAVATKLYTISRACRILVFSGSFYCKSSAVFCWNYSVPKKLLLTGKATCGHDKRSCGCSSVALYCSAEYCLCTARYLSELSLSCLYYGLRNFCIVYSHGCIRWLFTLTACTCHSTASMLVHMYCTVWGRSAIYKLKL